MNINDFTTSATSRKVGKSSNIIAGIFVRIQTVNLRGRFKMLIVLISSRSFKVRGRSSCHLNVVSALCSRLCLTWLSKFLPHSYCLFRDLLDFEDDTFGPTYLVTSTSPPPLFLAVPMIPTVFVTLNEQNHKSVLGAKCRRRCECCRSRQSARS